MPSVSKSAAASKPADLFTRHPRGYWVKRVSGRYVYFGRIDSDPHAEAAAQKWAEQKEDLLAGRTPRAKLAGLTIEDLADHHIEAKKQFVSSGELKQRTYEEYFATCERLIEQFGRQRWVDDLRPDDFDRLRKSIAKQWGPVRLANEIQRVRSIFKYGFEATLIKSPIQFGPTFNQ